MKTINPQMLDRIAGGLRHLPILPPRPIRPPCRISPPPRRWPDVPPPRPIPGPTLPLE